MNKEKSIEYILDKGLLKPKSTFEKIREIIRNIGLRSIFWDTSYTVICSSITAIFLIIIQIYSDNQLKYSSAFAIAPVLFILITTFTYLTERFNGIYELKQTLKYTSEQITVIRILFYSGIGTIFTAIIAAFSTSTFHGFATLFPICLSALFLTAFFMTIFSKYKFGNIIFSCLWGFFNLALILIFREKWEEFLVNIPILYALIICIISFTFIMLKLKYMLKKSNYIYV